MPKRVINNHTKLIAANMKKLAQGMEASGLPEGSEKLVGDIMDMVVNIAADRAFGGAMVCITAKDKPGEHEAAQGTFIMSKAGVSIYYELMGRLLSVADGLRSSAQELDEAIGEAGKQKKEGGMN